MRDELHPYPIFANALTERGLYGYSSKYKIKDECITITGRGDIGKVFYRKGFFTPIVRLITAIPRKNINAKFMSFSCECIKFWNETTGVPQLTIPQVQRYKILLPPLAEQEKIAEILSCWDEGIEKLSALIEKKKLQKKALMQKLLTAKIRLPGFTDPWKNVKLGDVCKISTGESNREDSSLDGKYTFFDRSQEVRTSNRYLFDGEAIIVAGEGQDFVPKYFFGKFDLHQRSYCLMNFENIFGKFLFFLLSLNKNYFLQQAVGSTVKSLRLPMFLKMKLYLPSSLAEQKAIADILSKADAEIELLNKKLAAFNLEKKAMMQKLLTGQIRVKVN